MVLAEIKDRSGGEMWQSLFLGFFGEIFFPPKISGFPPKFNGVFQLALLVNIQNLVYMGQINSTLRAKGSHKSARAELTGIFRSVPN